MVIWQASARADVLRLVTYIAEQNPIAARRIARELVAAGDSLADFPTRGRQGCVPGTRELLIIAPYIIVYEVTASDRVEILRVWHGAQQR